MTAYPEDCTLLVCCEDGYRTELSLRPVYRVEWEWTDDGTPLDPQSTHYHPRPMPPELP